MSHPGPARAWKVRWRKSHATLRRESAGVRSLGTRSDRGPLDELRAVFERHGNVASVSVITDRETGRSRGFAFVEMDDASAADDAIRALDGSELGGRNLRVNEAQDRRSGGGGGGRDRY